jgi:DNA-binding transcriptional LysR family regulator
MPMDRFEAMRVFTRVVERRSFTLAADDLGLPRSTVTDAVKQLEARLGVRLLERTTRQVARRWTARPLPALPRVDRRSRGCRRRLRRRQAEGPAARRCAGHAGASLPAAGPAGLPRRISRHRAQHERGRPLVDLIREGVDCVLRVGELPDSDMIARRSRAGGLTCAAPAYLERFGTPPLGRARRPSHDRLPFVGDRRVLPLEFKSAARCAQVTLPPRCR